MVLRRVGDDSSIDDVVQRLQPLLGASEGEPAPLAGGITNRNFKLRLGGVDYVARIHGRDTDLLGIDRDAERLACERAAALGIAPEVAAAIEGCLVTRFVGDAHTGVGKDGEHVASIGAALRSFHDSALRLPVRFWVPELLDTYAAVVRERGGELPEHYAQTAAVSARIAAALPLERACPCHNDLLPGNVMRGDDGATMLIDWEYAGMGHRLFDLGNLAVNNDLDEDAERRLLLAYDGAPASEGRHAALKLMRVLSDAREAAWGVVQGVISALEFDFDGYAQQHFERLRRAVEGPAFERWLAIAEG